MKFFTAFLALALLLHAEDDLFTGVPKKPVPPQVERFLKSVQRAVESGESSQVLRLVSSDGMTGAGIVVYRKRLGAIKKGVKVKSIEMIDGVLDEDIEFQKYGVIYKPTTSPTNTVAIRLEDESETLQRLDLPAAEVQANRDKIWRLIGLVPEVPEGSTVGILEAENRRGASSSRSYMEAEVVYLKAVLGRRKEVEESEANLLKIAEGKGKRMAPYIYSRLGWSWVNLDDAKKAVEYFKKGADLDGAGVWTNGFGLAVGYYSNGEFDKAVRHFDRVAGLGNPLSDRAELEQYMSGKPEKERSAALGLQTLWMRTMVPQ